MTVVFVALASVCGATLVRASRTVVARAHAQNAADGTALALVTSGPTVAGQLARVGGFRIVSVHDDGTTVEVSVNDGGVIARANARRAAEPAAP